MVIVSIIVGLGITTLLRGAVNTVRADTEMTPGLLHGLWVVLVLYQHVALWSLRWSGERREEWPTDVLLGFLLIPIFFYAQAELLFPLAGRKVNLTEDFLSNRRLFFSLAILSFAAAAIGSFVFYDGADPFGGDTVPVILYVIASGVSLIAGLLWERAPTPGLRGNVLGPYGHQISPRPVSRLTSRRDT
jgi:hypothetical protein